MYSLISPLFVGAGSLGLGVILGIPFSLLFRIGFRDILYKPLELLRHVMRSQLSDLLRIILFYLLFSAVIILILRFTCCGECWRSYLKMIGTGFFSSIAITASNVTCFLPKAYSSWVDPVPLEGSEGFFKETLSLFLSTTDDFVKAIKHTVNAWRNEEMEAIFDSWRRVPIGDRLKILREYDSPSNGVGFSDATEKARRECLEVDYEDGVGGEERLHELLQKFLRSCYEESPAVAKSLVRRSCS